MAPYVFNSFMEFSYNVSCPFQNKPKDLDISHKMDLDFWDCFGMEKKTLSYNGGDTETSNLQ